MTDHVDEQWKDAFREKCLDGKTESHAWEALALPLEGFFEARGKPLPVRHFLLRLPARKAEAGVEGDASAVATEN